MGFEHVFAFCHNYKKMFKLTDFGAKYLPRAMKPQHNYMMAQDGSTMAQYGPKMVSRWPNLAQDGPKMALWGKLGGSKRLLLLTLEHP